MFLQRTENFNQIMAINVDTLKFHCILRLCVCVFSTFFITPLLSFFTSHFPGYSICGVLSCPSPLFSSIGQHRTTILLFLFHFFPCGNLLNHGLPHLCSYYCKPTNSIDTLFDLFMDYLLTSSGLTIIHINDLQKERLVSVSGSRENFLTFILLLFVLRLRLRCPLMVKSVYVVKSYPIPFHIPSIDCRRKMMAAIIVATCMIMSFPLSLHFRFANCSLISLDFIKNNNLFSLLDSFFCAV